MSNFSPSAYTQHVCHRIFCKYQGAIFPLQNGLVLGKVDCEVESSIAHKFQITKYPTLKMWRNGQVTYTYNKFYSVKAHYLTSVFKIVWLNKNIRVSEHSCTMWTGVSSY